MFVFWYLSIFSKLQLEIIIEILLQFLIKIAYHFKSKNFYNFCCPFDLTFFNQTWILKYGI